MINLKKEEMLKTIGGGSGWLVFALGTIITFFAGVIDGQTKP